jgi:hypothetical protein
MSRAGNDGPRSSAASTATRRAFFASIATGLTAASTAFSKSIMGSFPAIERTRSTAPSCGLRPEAWLKFARERYNAALDNFCRASDAYHSAARAAEAVDTYRLSMIAWRKSVAADLAGDHFERCEIELNTASGRASANA